MKSCVATLVAISLSVLLAHIGHGQTAKGAFMAGGDISLNFNDVARKIGSGSYRSPTETNTMRVTPSVGYFFLDGLVGGLSVDYTRMARKQSQGTAKNVLNTISLNPFVRYYFGNRFFVMANTGFGLGTGKNTIAPGVETELDIETFQWGAGFGYAIFLNDYVALEPLVAYRSNDYSHSVSKKTTVRTSGLFVGLSTNIFLY